MAASPEQRNPYQGVPPRPWLRVRLEGPDGQFRDLRLVADTGSPFALIISPETMETFLRRPALPVKTNFGALQGGWLQIAVPELGVTHEVLAYAGDAVVEATKGSSADFEGLTGLPFLRLFEFGGDAQFFWIKPRSRA